MNLNQVTVAATDIQASAAFYRALGLKQIVSSEHYARFELPEGDATFSIHYREHVPQPSGVVVYFECADMDAKVAALQASGFVFDRLPEDQRWLWREARLRDPDGNEICLFWAGEHRKNPPWRLSESEIRDLETTDGRQNPFPITV